METQRVLIDVDTGHDDAFAILLAAAHPSLTLEGITVVAGNADLERTVDNTLKIREAADLEHLPVYAGMHRPILRPPIRGVSHGVSGLDGFEFPPPRRGAEDGHAVDFLVDTVRKAPGKVTVIATGPLTNIAMAILKDPGFAGACRELVIMGGSVYGGNRTPTAEFNILADPEAAKIVVDSGIRLRVVPLEVTHKAIFTESEVAYLENLNTHVGKVTGALLRFFVDSHRTKFGLPGASIHDACAVAAVIDPDVVQFQTMPFDVEIHGSLTVGQTVCDPERIWKDPHLEAAVGMDLNFDRFRELLLGALARYK